MSQKGILEFPTDFQPAQGKANTTSFTSSMELAGKRKTEKWKTTIPILLLHMHFSDGSNDDNYKKLVEGSKNVIVKMNNNERVKRIPPPQHGVRDVITIYIVLAYLFKQSDPKMEVTYHLTIRCISHLTQNMYFATSPYTN